MLALVKSSLEKIALVIAGIIILVAVVILTVRLCLDPLLNRHKPEIEQWASQLLNFQVDIKNIRIDWLSYQPVLKLSGVTLSDKEKHQPLLQIQKVKILFSLWRSLVTGSAQPNGFMVAGTAVNIHQTSSGDVKVQGLLVFQAQKKHLPVANTIDFKQVLGWLLFQERIILKDIDVHFYTEDPHAGLEKELKFITLYDLKIENDAKTHLLFGKCILHQVLPTAVTLGVKWSGPLENIAATDGRVYLEVSGLSLMQWLKDYHWQQWQIVSGAIDGKLWARWRQGQLRSVQSDFAVLDLNLFAQETKQAHVINRVSGHLGWHKDKTNTQTFAGEDILIDLPNRLWPVSSFYVALNPDHTPKLIKLGYVDIGDVRNLLLSAPSVLPAYLLQLLQNLKPQGSMQNTLLSFNGPWQDWQKIQAQTYLRNISIASWNGLPALNHFSAQLHWNGDQGNAVIGSELSTFTYDKVFSQAIEIDQLTGELNWQYVPKDNVWQIKIPFIHTYNKDTVADVKGQFNLTAAGPVADLTAHFSLQRAGNIINYLPLHLFEKDLVLWLQSAFSNGEVNNVTAILKGPLNQFPFDQNNGVFQVEGDIEQANLHYADEWPDLTEVTGHLTFKNRSFSLVAPTAKILNVVLHNIRADIPDLSANSKDLILTVKSDPIQMDVAQGLQFIHQSPLQASLGKIFARLKLSGAMRMNVQLQIPLNDGYNTQVQGQIAMLGDDLQVPAWHLRLQHLQGDLAFTEKSISANRLIGVLFNKPVQLNLSTLAQGKNNTVRVQLQNNFSVKDIEKWLGSSIEDRVQGAADFTTQIDISLTAPIKVQWQSNLVGLQLNLPGDLHKTPSESRNFVAEMQVLDEENLRVKIAYADLIHAAFLLQHEKENQEKNGQAYRVTAANLHLGSGEAAWPESAGLTVTGNFAELDWQKMQSYMQEGQGQGQGWMGLAFHGVDINVQRLQLGGQRLTGVNLKATAEENDWHVVIDSHEAAGELLIPKKITRQGEITAQFSRLHLQGVGENASKVPSLQVDRLPQLSIVARDVSFNGVALGKITFHALSQGRGMQIEDLQLDAPGMTLRAQGEWTGDNVTRLQGRLELNNVGVALNNLSLGGHNIIANNGMVNFNLSWDAPPFAPNMASLNGEMTLDVGAGRIVDVGAAGGSKMGIGRMLNIFSLQTIPRRLSGDFSDVVQKGYSFDDIRGNFTLRNGSAYTNNLRLEGTVAKVAINGRIGLKAQDYDLTVSVTPYITASLPIAAALVTAQPLIGLAALAVNTVVGPQVSKVSTYYYSVRGPWDHPQWVSVQGP
jgi:uncharacterized protein (TIGR02099 family)